MLFAAHCSHLPRWAGTLTSPRPVFGAAAHRISAAHNWHEQMASTPWELREAALAGATGRRCQLPFDL